jgi:hypothetical protein
MNHGTLSKKTFQAMSEHVLKTYGESRFVKLWEISGEKWL